jgi:hypothetical protein
MLKEGISMITYKETIVSVKDEVFCNCCGKKIVNGDFLEVEKSWGFFSSKDGVKESFELCEACYDSFVDIFKIPPTRESNIEY